MLNLDPAKLLVIAVVAIILLGPDRLPQVARQAGAAWRSFNEFRHRMESEVRNTMPDLPSSSEIARLARSPTALLNHLSSMSDSPASTNGDGEPASDGEGEPSANGDAATTASTGDGASAEEPAPAATAGADPSATAADPSAAAADPSQTAADASAPPVRPAPFAEVSADDQPLSVTGPEPRRTPSDPGVVAPGDPTLN